MSEGKKQTKVSTNSNNKRNTIYQSFDGKTLEEYKSQISNIVLENSYQYKDYISMHIFYSHLKTSEELQKIANIVINNWSQKETEEMEHRKYIIKRILLLLNIQLIITNVIFILIGFNLINYSDDVFLTFIRLTLIEIFGVSAAIIGYIFKERSIRVLKVLIDFFQLIFSNNDKFLNKVNQNSSSVKNYKDSVLSGLEIDNTSNNNK